MKCIWFEKVKNRGDDIPTCMGRSMFETTEEFLKKFKENIEKQKYANENYEEEYGDKWMA